MNTLNLIRNSFDDERDMFEIERDLFLVTEEPGIVKFQFYFGDITPKILAEITEECEKLWEKFGGIPIYHYNMIDPNSRVTVPEHTIESEADFTIRVARMNEDPVSIMLEVIEEKINNNSITDFDINALRIVPMMVKKEKRIETRIRVNELLSKIIQE